MSRTENMQTGYEYHEIHVRGQFNLNCLTKKSAAL